MFIYHVTPYEPFQEVDLSQYGNDECDFGRKMYFHLFYDDALTFSRYIGGGNIAEVEIPDDLLSWQKLYSYEGYSISRVGFCGDNENGQFEDMTRAEKLEFARLIIAYRRPDLGFVPAINTDIMFGSRADANAVVIINNYIHNRNDYNDDVIILQVFDEWQTLNLGPQMAFNQIASARFITGRMKWL